MSAYRDPDGNLHARTRAVRAGFACADKIAAYNEFAGRRCCCRPRMSRKRTARRPSWATRRTHAVRLGDLRGRETRAATLDLSRPLANTARRLASWAADTHTTRIKMRCAPRARGRGGGPRHSRRIRRMGTGGTSAASPDPAAMAAWAWATPPVAWKRPCTSGPGPSRRLCQRLGVVGSGEPGSRRRRGCGPTRKVLSPPPFDARRLRRRRRRQFAPLPPHPNTRTALASEA